MSRDAVRRFEDILAAIERCLQYREHLTHTDPRIAGFGGPLPISMARATSVVPPP